MISNYSNENFQMNFSIIMLIIASAIISMVLFVLSTTSHSNITDKHLEYHQVIAALLNNQTLVGIKILTVRL